MLLKLVEIRWFHSIWILWFSFVMVTRWMHLSRLDRFFQYSRTKDNYAKDGSSQSKIEATTSHAFEHSSVFMEMAFIHMLFSDEVPMLLVIWRSPEHGWTHTHTQPRAYADCMHMTWCARVACISMRIERMRRHTLPMRRLSLFLLSLLLLLFVLWS